jgi:hypothetical protein
LLNSFLQFYKKLNKLHKSFLFDNESFIEIFIYMNIFDSAFNGNRNTKASTYKYFNQRILLQTLIMIINTNKVNKIFSEYISNLLTKLLIQPYKNILNILNIFDISSINFEVCRKLLSKIMTSKPSGIAPECYYRKIISQMLHIITNLKIFDKPGENIEGVLNYLVDLFLEICVGFKDDINFEVILFESLFSSLFYKFGWKIKTENLKQIEISEVKKDLKINLDARFIKYLFFITDKFGIVIKSSFPNVLKILSQDKLAYAVI